MADEGKQEMEGAESKPHPETVSWTQYIGLKEKFNKTESELTGKVQTLEEHLKTTTSADEFNKVKQELESIKTEHQKVSDELKTTKDKTLSEKRDILIKKGILEDQVKDMSEKELDTVNKALEQYKPKPDLGSGGGRTELRGSPMELALRAYSK